VLTVHHLVRSQSERIVWLCEELGIDYVLKCYERDKTTMLAPPEFKAMDPIGSAPVITEGDLVLPESCAIVDYIIAKHGGGRLAFGPDHPDYAAYLYWYHFTNGTLQPMIARNYLVRRLEVAADHPVRASVKARLDTAMAMIDARLGKTPYLAGAELTAADIMIVFSLTTSRLYVPVDLSPYPNIRAYLQRIAARDAYRRAIQKGDPGMAPLLD
jgi:glutathione S-transferase